MQNNKLKISYDPSIPNEKMDSLAETTNFCSWNRLREYLGKAAATSEDNIKGVIADEKGLVIIFHNFK